MPNQLRLAKPYICLGDKVRPMEDFPELGLKYQDRGKVIELLHDDLVLVEFKDGTRKQISTKFLWSTTLHYVQVPQEALPNEGKRQIEDVEGKPLNIVIKAFVYQNAFGFPDHPFKYEIVAFISMPEDEEQRRALAKKIIDQVREIMFNSDDSKGYELEIRFVTETQNELVRISMY